MLTALSLIEEGNLEITPWEAPRFFEWSLELTPNKAERVLFYSWNTNIEGKTADEYRRLGLLKPIKPEFYFLLPTIRSNEFVNVFGVGPALVGAPLFWALKWFSPNSPNAIKRRDNQIAFLITHSQFPAAVFAAAAAAILFLLCNSLGSLWQALTVTFVFGLCSCIWSLSSQAYWQQTPNIFFLCLGTYFICRKLRTSRDVFLAGLAFGTATVIRQTSVFFLLAALGISLRKKAKQNAPVYLAAATPFLLFVLAYNFYYFGSPFINGQALCALDEAMRKTGSSDIWGTPLWEGATGLLFSPSRGLFFYSPIFLFSAFGIYYLVREKEKSDLLVFLPAVLLTAMLQFKWYDWWGGYSYGYRPILEVLPFLSLFLLPVLQRLETNKKGSLAFIVLLLWSFQVQWIGMAYDGFSWDNRRFESVDDRKFRSRLWSFKDNPIFFYWGQSRETCAKIRDSDMRGFLTGEQ